MVFGKKVSEGQTEQYNEVIFGDRLKEFIEPGSIYEASAFTESLSRLALSNGIRVTKLTTFEGFELWWLNYNSLFFYFGLPYTQYRKLLEYLKNFEYVSFDNPPYKSLFSYYLEAYGCEVKIVNKDYRFIHFGILLQVLITVVSLPILILQRRPVLFFTGDKFEKGKDYDFRMRFVYKELRGRNIHFVEFVRSLESWKIVLKHALARKRPVIYSEAITFLSRLIGDILDKRFDTHLLTSKVPADKFKLQVATHYIQNAPTDIWSVRLTKLVLKAIGVRAGFFTAFTERNAQTVLGCKLNAIPTVGVLHGLPSRYYNIYDFMPGFDAERVLTVDKYGVWSEWWKEYYIKYSRAYRSEQLYVSGPMRPLEKSTVNRQPTTNNGPIRVLFVSEQLAAPSEVLPYLNKLLGDDNIILTIKFRPAKDGFEEWLIANKPEVIKAKNINILRGSITDAVKECDVTIGSHSTAVLEALLEFKIPILYQTKKWGDCFSLKEYGKGCPFFAENPKELIKKIKSARSVSTETLKDLQERYFGDPYQNGSAWVADQLRNFLATT